MAKKNLMYTNHPCKIEEIYTKEDYQYYLQENELNEKDYSYEEYLEFMADTDFDNIKYCEYAKYAARINGTLGLWNGSPKIEPVICKDLMSALNKCTNNMDYVTIECDKKKIYIECVHHDGTNYFEVELIEPAKNAKWDVFDNCWTHYRRVEIKDGYLY